MPNQKWLRSSCCTHRKSLGFPPTHGSYISCIYLLYDFFTHEKDFRLIRGGSKQLKTCISNLGSEMWSPYLLDTDTRGGWSSQSLRLLNGNKWTHSQTASRFLGMAVPLDGSLACLSPLAASCLTGSEMFFNALVARMDCGIHLLLSCLVKHCVVEMEDQTITVRNSSSLHKAVR